MAGIKDLKTATKMKLMIGLTIAGYVLLAWLGYSTINEVKVNGPIYQSISLGKALDADVVPPNLYLSEARLHIRGLLNEKESSQFAARIEEYKANVKDFHDTHDSYEKSLDEGPIKQLVRGTAYTQGLAWVDVMNQKLIPAKYAGDEKLANSLFNDADTLFAEHRKAIVELADAVEKENKEKEEAAGRTTSRRMLEVGAAIVAICTLVSLFGWFASRSINTSIRKTVDVLRATAEGDLRKRVEVDSNDELGQMGDALNHTLDRISDAMREIGTAAGHLSTASDEFSNTSQQITANSEETSTQARVVSTATEQVSQNLQTVASGSNQMAITVKDIAQNAQEAAKVAAKAQRTAEKPTTSYPSSVNRARKSEK